MATKSNESLSAGWVTFLFLLIGTICIFIWRRHATSSKPALSTANQDPDASLPTRKGVYLQEIDLNRTEADTDIDIIAIHGLDTKSPDTWTWKDPRDPNNKRKWVNWLGPGMLPTSVDRVRIFTCDWPADLLLPSDLIQKTIEDYALLLLEGIESALFTCTTRPQDRPILFIASCLGGLILIRALVHADDRKNTYYPLREATRGIIFLATPFRGTSFQDVAVWAEIGLKANASTQGRNVSRLLDSVKGSTFQLEESVRNFTRLSQDNDNPCAVFSFFELGTTSLPHKALPWLPHWFHQKKQLVNRSSATLDIIIDPLPLDRPHSLMNKFKNSECKDYKKVANKLYGMAQMIRAGTPLEQADKLIRNKHYTADRLKIERLSGDLLPIDQCYINLAITKQSVQEARPSMNNGNFATSPFSLFARQKVDASDKSMQVELAAIFNEREGNENTLIHPRRILIRGRAGVGKSTLCKKMVYDFTRGIDTELHRSWKKLFDRVLWMPLRRLKIQPSKGWILENLFYHEYFKKAGDDEGHRLAKRLSQVLRSPNTGRTLFILDGLDEVSGSWDIEDYRTEILLELLNQPAVIITSRPSAVLPAGVHKTDLDLETIGFYPDQVEDYIKKTFTDREKVDKVQSFVQERWLIQGLVRIPIQLDALCYTWDDLNPGKIPNTMTELYEDIELKLWKKDAVRLEKTHKDKVLTPNDLRTVDRIKIERFATDEMLFLECLAFAGLHNDVIEFTSDHLNDISNRFAPGLLLDNSLPSLSFLRTSDPLSKFRNRNYHFIHLTFQEYFAAQYFTRQWKDPEGQLQFLTLGSNHTMAKSRPIEFLRKQKYTARYDIFWRFVAGLLNASGQSSEFISTLEDEPLDLLGPTHQRLVMHCLSETSGDLPLRETLEQRLVYWLLFECRFIKQAGLAREMEFPEAALKTVLSVIESHEIKLIILRSLATRASVSQRIAEAVAAQLGDEHRDVRKAAIGALHTRTALPDGILLAVAARLGDKDEDVRKVASRALAGCAELSDEVLKDVAARLGDKDPSVKKAAINALRARTALPDGILLAMVARLSDEDQEVRYEAIEALSIGVALSDEVLRAIVARLSDKDLNVRKAAVKALSINAALPNDSIRAMVASLGDNNPGIRRNAIEALSECVTLPDKVIEAVVARLTDECRIVRQAATDALGRRAALPDEVIRAIAARLSDKDWRVRYTAVKALSRRVALPVDVIAALVLRFVDKEWGLHYPAIEAFSTLPDDVIAAWIGHRSDFLRLATTRLLTRRVAQPSALIKAVVALLNDKSLQVRIAATRALGERATLPDEVLRALAAQLGDKDHEVRAVAIDAVSTRAALPDEMLKGVAALLDDEQLSIRQAAAGALTQKREHLHRILHSKERIISFYKACLEESFDEQLSWYIENDYCYMNGPGGIGQIFPDIRGHEIREWISQARPAGCPSISSR